MRNDLKAAVDTLLLRRDYIAECLIEAGTTQEKRLSEEVEALDTALAALRDVQARQKGCKYCAINDWERKPLATFNTYFNNYEEEQHEIGIDDYEGGYRIASTLGNNGPSVDIRFCPSCGRPLEPVGNADMLATVSKTESVGQGPEPGIRKEAGKDEAN